MNMRDAQLLAKAEDPAHACHSLLTLKVTAGAVRTTPAAYLRGCLESVPPRPRDISMARHIHNTYASRVIEERESNTILGFPPPQVDPSEEWLPRSDRVNLCRLGCGHHAGLWSHRFRIGLETDDLCLRCLGASDTVAHVIEECPALTKNVKPPGSGRASSSGPNLQKLQSFCGWLDLFDLH